VRTDKVAELITFVAKPNDNISVRNQSISDITQSFKNEKYMVEIFLFQSLITGSLITKSLKNLLMVKQFPQLVK